MSDGPYCEFAKEELILRDHLAIDRTILANERTLLAYLRLALTLFVAGLTFIKFFYSLWADIIGVLCLPIGGFAILIGVSRYKKMAKLINSARSID